MHTIKAGYRFDHSKITLTLTFGEETERRLFWKCNNSLLKETFFVNEITTFNNNNNNNNNNKNNKRYLKRCTFTSHTWTASLHPTMWPLIYFRSVICMTYYLQNIDQRQFRMLLSKNNNTPTTYKTAIVISKVKAIYWKWEKAIRTWSTGIDCD